MSKTPNVWRWLLVLSALLSITALVPSSLPAQSSADAPQAASCTGPEYRQLDFWVGDWRVETPEGILAGENHVEAILDGCAIQENWSGVQGSSGKSFNMYFARDGKWHQTWVDNAGTRLDLSGGLEGKVMVYRGIMPGANGGEVRHEIRFEPLKDGAVRQHWTASRDGGKTWADLFLGIYRRKGS